MPSFLSKLRSFKTQHTQPQSTQKDHTEPAAALLPRPKTPDWTARRTFSISPKLRTFFEPQTPKIPTTPTTALALGVLDSSTADSPESAAYSGVVALGFDVEIVRRVSKGKVKRIELSKVQTYESACVGTQTEETEDVITAGARARKALKRKSGLAKSGWELFHIGDAGLLFMTSPAKQQQDGGGENGKASGGGFHSVEDTAMPMTGTLLLKLQQAIAADADLQACQKRTSREIATLNAYQENLRKRKDALKGRLQVLKFGMDCELDEEKVAVDKELVRVWEASIDTMDERLRCEERLERKREVFEVGARAALAVLALGLAERSLVDVVEGGERKGSEVEFEKRFEFEKRLSLGER